MSGGHFDYKQTHIREILESIQYRVRVNGQTVQRDDYFESRQYTHEDLGPEVLAKFQQAIDTLSLAAIMAQRIDWLLSGDDGEEQFHARWNQEISAYLLLKQTP